jgi:hypothetical protein
MTATIAIAKLIRKNARSHNTIVLMLILPGAGDCDRNEIIDSPIKETTTAVSIIISSSQGGWKNLDFFIFNPPFPH